MTNDAERAQALQIDAVILRKETNEDTFSMRIQGSYPKNRYDVWAERLHPARLLALLEQDAKREE